MENILSPILIFPNTEPGVELSPTWRGSPRFCFQCFLALPHTTATLPIIFSERSQGFTLASPNCADLNTRPPSVPSAHPRSIPLAAAPRRGRAPDMLRPLLHLKTVNLLLRSPSLAENTPLHTHTLALETL